MRWVDVTKMLMTILVIVLGAIWHKIDQVETKVDNGLERIARVEGVLGVKEIPQQVAKEGP